MESKILKTVQFFVFICCFVSLLKIDLKADPLFPYSNPDGVIVDYSGYADTDKVHVVSSGFGGYTANSEYDWLYISKANISKGVIKGKKKGKATISVKVTVTDNTTKIFKTKVVVDKRLSASSS